MFQRFRSRQPPVCPPRDPLHAKYRAVSVQPGGHACPVVLRLEGERFLVSDAPSLPLGGCSRGPCECRYQHHGDRRMALRRYTDRPVFPTHHAGPERRLKIAGRRAADAHKS